MELNKATENSYNYSFLIPIDRYLIDLNSEVVRCAF